jgi:hypothetical protein
MSQVESMALWGACADRTPYFRIRLCEITGFYIESSRSWASGEVCCFATVTHAEKSSKLTMTNRRKVLQCSVEIVKDFTKSFERRNRTWHPIYRF